MFLSADLDAMDEAIDSGFFADSSLAFDKSSTGVKSAFSSLALNIRVFRFDELSDVRYTDEDRAKQGVEKKRKNRR